MRVSVPRRQQRRLFLTSIHTPSFDLHHRSLQLFPPLSFSLSALSHSPTYISHPMAECISVAMATQSGAFGFPGEASHSLDPVLCLCGRQRDCLPGLRVRASVAVRRNAGQDVGRKFQSRCEKHTQRWLKLRPKCTEDMNHGPQGPTYTLTHSSAGCSGP